MVRRMDSRMEHPVTWKCPACDYFLPLPDEEFKQRVFLLQKKLADKPLLAEKEEDEIPVTSMEARRLTNEIFRKLDSGVYSEDELVNLALQCAAKNYEAISSARHITVILSRLVDTFISRISLTMLPVPKPHNTACVLSWEEARRWQSRSSGYSSS